MQRARSQSGWNPAATVRQQLRQSLSGTPWEELFPAHVAALFALLERKAGEAYTHIVASVQPFIKARLHHWFPTDPMMLLFNGSHSANLAGYGIHAPLFSEDCLQLL